MNTTCEDVTTLLASYLDGELSEDQASTVRSHLLACSSCREAMQEGKVIRRWMHEARQPAEVPQGFAARVARRAFAGDPGLLEPVPAPREKPILGFVLGLSAAAAALLFAFSLSIQLESLPEDGSLDATERFWDVDPVEDAEGPTDTPDAEEEDADAEEAR